MKFRKTDAEPLIESYEDRVARAADAVKSSATFHHEYSDNPQKLDLHQLAHDHTAGSLEGKLGGSAHRDMIRDVKKLAGPHVASINRSIAGKQSYAAGRSGLGQSKQALHDFHMELGDHIDSAIGNSIPDGDPFDSLLKKTPRLAAQHGVRMEPHETIDHLDKASQKRGYHDYHDHLAHAWDSYDKDVNGPGEHLVTYHKDDPDGQAKHAEYSKMDLGDGRVAHAEPNALHGDHVDVFAKHPFENPWGKPKPMREDLSFKEVFGAKEKQQLDEQQLRLAGKPAAGFDPDGTVSRKDSGSSALMSMRQQGAAAQSNRSKYMGTTSSDLSPVTKLVHTKKNAFAGSSASDIDQGRMALTTKKSVFTPTQSYDLRPDLKPRPITYKQVLR